MLWKTILLVACVCACCSAHTKAEVHPDVGLRVPNLVKKYHYPIEVHPVITEDDYILTIHRIPHGKNNFGEVNKPVVFLMHGLLCSSADWVVMGPEKGLAFLLADMGYDVWMGNARGNTYSRSHLHLSPDHDKKKFWDFSWHEIGKYDLPTMIDYILEKTGEEKLFYIGHSQGTTSFFVMTSTLPTYNDKIRLMVALAPVAYMDNIPNKLLRRFAIFHRSLARVTSLLGATEFLPSTILMQKLGQKLCNEKSIVQSICSNILFLINGYDSEQLNRTMIPVILSNTPAGASIKQIIHYAQEISSGKFRQYDYGLDNANKYGQLFPPEYDLSKVSAPVALLYGQNDLLTAEVDIDRLKEEIARPIVKYKIKHDKFNHLDFLWSIDIIPLVYAKVFELLEKY